MPTKILVVEDDPGVREIIEVTLSRENFDVEVAEDGDKALARLDSPDYPDLVILDVMLPGRDGVEVCREIRKKDEPRGWVPIIMLTARDDETSVVVGLEVGADDYITKPFKSRELVSRVRAHLRRRRLEQHDRKSNPQESGESSKLCFPGLEIDLLRREVLAGGEPVELTAKQFDILALLASSPGQVHSREQIMRHLWDGDFFGEARAADVHIQHIRKKTEPDPAQPRYILTLRGVGYKFVSPQ